MTNIKALVEQLNKLKPASQKGIYLRKLSVSSTMGIGARVDPVLALIGSAVNKRTPEAEEATPGFQLRS